MGKRIVAVTGARGIIAGKVLPGLTQRYELRLIDKRITNRDGEEQKDVRVCDLLDRNRDHYREHFRGVDTVIHSGFVRPEADSNPFWAELDNVAMAYNVYQTCIEEGVRRVVVISSNHAADFYEQLILDGSVLSIGPETPAYSDNFYGWAKVAYEALGLVFAVGKINDGTRLPNVQIRIGAPRETDLDACNPGDLRRLKRGLGAYLSLRDELQLLVKSIETENIENEWGVPFQIFYGVSGNSGNFWSIDNARRVIGYQPEDDAFEHFADHIVRVLGVR